MNLQESYLIFFELDVLVAISWGVMVLQGIQKKVANNVGHHARYLIAILLIKIPKKFGLN